MTGDAAAGGGPRVDVIVVLRGGTDASTAAADMAIRDDGELAHVYGHALRGFAGRFPQGRIAALEHDPRVAYVQATDRGGVEALYDAVVAAGNDGWTEVTVTY